MDKLNSLWAFLNLAKKIWEVGGPAVQAVIKAAQDFGVEHDNEEMAKVAQEASERSRRREQELEGL